MATALTDAAVKKFKPKAKRRWIRDGGSRSLYLVIQPSGTKSWVMRFRRPDGRPGKLVLGAVDISGKELRDDPKIGQSLSLPAARALAASVHRDRAMGHDVVANHKVNKSRRRAEFEEQAAGAFGGLVRKYIEEYARLKTRRWRSTVRFLGLSYPPDGGEPTATRGGLAERWADKPVAELDGHDIYAVVDEARRTAVPGVVPRNKGMSEARARALFSALSGLFRWLHRHRRITANPCVGLFRPPTPKARDRVLNEEEIRRFWKACDAAPKAYAAAAKLLLLTGGRLREVAEMERPSELSADGATWMLPGRRTKNHRSHIVPLTPLAREVIATAPQLEGCRFVFSTNGSGPVTAWSRAKATIDTAMGAGVPPWRLHDLRRSTVTGLVELGVAPHVVEAVVNHVSGSRAGVAGVYNKAELLPERRAALERWARFVALVVDADLHAAHESFLAAGDDEARKMFNNAIAEGGDPWSHYLKTITADGEANVVPMPTWPRQRS